MPASSGSTGAAGGLRERKRRETHARVVDAGICLFVEKGYEATTIDEIAAAAGISRRTFFHYFDSKDDILLSLQSGMGEMLAARVRAAPAGVSPREAVRDAAIAVCAALPADDMIAIDRLMRTSAAVQARKQASYVQHEQTLFAALRERWPDPERETGLRLIAMTGIGTMRLASDLFHKEEGRRPIQQILRDAFEALSREIG